MTQPPEASVEPTPTRQARRPRGFLAELVVITLGVLIALSLEGLRQLASDRALVRQAEATILREIEENRSELERVLETTESRDRALEQALRFADELLRRGFTEVDELELGFTLAEVSAASWATAERTGALSHMEYERVRDYSRIYEAQELFVERQRGMLERLAAATAIVAAGGDPTEADERDLLAFRERVLALRADLYIQQQLAERALALYESALARSRTDAEPDTSPAP